MNDAELNRIIEETFQNIVRNEGPDIFQRFTGLVRDISNSFINETRTHHVEPTVTPVVDVSNDVVGYGLLADFSDRWFQQLNNYHCCMRDYHKNMIQINRTTNNLLLNIASSEHNTSTMRTNMPYSRLSSFLQPSFNTMEIQGFSIPLPTTTQTAAAMTYPTITQILDATEVFLYTEESQTTRGLETRCPISLEDFVIGDELCEIRYCHHVFKWINLQHWFSRHSNCPVCRYDIR